MNWSKIRTVISAQGWNAAGLAGLDFNQPLLMLCISPRSINSVSNVIVLPQARRSDPGAEPTAWANDAQGNQFEVGYTLLGDTMTIDPTPGTVTYTANYYPEITVFADPPNEGGDLSGAQFDWTLTAEEA